jgi:hypothetical protein
MARKTRAAAVISTQASSLTVPQATFERLPSSKDKVAIAPRLSERPKIVAWLQHCLFFPPFAVSA